MKIPLSELPHAERISAAIAASEFELCKAERMIDKKDSMEASKLSLPLYSRRGSDAGDASPVPTSPTIQAAPKRPSAGFDGALVFPPNFM